MRVRGPYRVRVKRRLSQAEPRRQERYQRKHTLSREDQGFSWLPLTRRGTKEATAWPPAGLQRATRHECSVECMHDVTRHNLASWSSHTPPPTIRRSVTSCRQRVHGPSAKSCGQPAQQKSPPQLKAPHFATNFFCLSSAVEPSFPRYFLDCRLQKHQHECLF